MMFNKLVLSLCLLIVLNLSGWAEELPTKQAEYVKSLKRIQLPFDGSTAIVPCSLDEKKRIIRLLPQSTSRDIANITMNKDGQIFTPWKEKIEIYKGDFSNEGNVEYALVSTGGSGHVNAVTIFKEEDNKLLYVNLDQVIINNLLIGKDMSSFYLHTANPFAITKEGKTYLRFMSYPREGKEYDKTQLLLCTYLWQGDKFILTGPNWSYSIDGDLVETKKCLGT